MSGHYPVAARGLPDPDQPTGLAAFFRRDGSLSRQRDWSPMLDLLYAAANNGTGKRAALAIPTFGKTGTTQENRDALFIGFAGDLVVGVWVGRDDNQSLGKVSGGTVPADIWRAFMAPALSIDRHRGPPLPIAIHKPQPKPKPQLQSPLPPEWSESTKSLRELSNIINELSGDE
jgi:penicillin-binding protein 1A